VPVTVSSSRPSISLLSKTANVPAIQDGAASSYMVQLSNADDLPLSSSLTFTLKSQSPFPRNGEIEIDTLDGTLRTVLTLAPSGGLLLQDPHTVVATLDPLRSFGPSAFGALHLRAIYPSGMERPITTRPGLPVQPGNEAAARLTTDLSQVTGSEAGRPEGAAPGQSAPPAAPANVSDWVPLVTLVRLPKLNQLQCPADSTLPCTLTGSDLFLVQSVSTDPAFADPTPVPDGFTGTTLTVPHPAASTVFLHLRDDPNPIDSVLFPAQPLPAVAHLHHSAAAAAKPAHGTPATGTQPTGPAQGTSQQQTGPAASPDPSGTVPVPNTTPQ